MITKRAIALDIGDKRIGIAVSDPFNEYAMPCDTYWRTHNFAKDVQAIADIVQGRSVGVIVCGMPYHFDGREGVQTEKTKKFIEALREKTNLPIVIEDERFTTMQARETQIAGGIKREDRKKTIDSIAASYILDGYLQREKKKKLEESKMAREKETMEAFEEDRIMELEADDGSIERLYHIATIEYKGNMYCCFQKAEPECEEEEDEVVLFALQGEGEDAVLVPMEDEGLMDEVFAEFCHQYENFEEEEALRLEGIEVDE